MPWHWKPMKDVAIYEKPRGGESSPKVNYRQGDTITVKGTAKAYSGAPLGNARVVYNVKRQQSWWWRMTGEGNNVLLSDTVTTDMHELVAERKIQAVVAELLQPVRVKVDATPVC